MAGLVYRDERYDYQVLPVVWINGYRTFRRRRGARWRPYKELPMRETPREAAEDLERHGEALGWIRM
jgi:hypothetical protein